MKNKSLLRVGLDSPDNVCSLLVLHKDFAGGKGLNKTRYVFIDPPIRSNSHFDGQVKVFCPV